MNNITAEQLNLLLRLFFAHLLADFVLQTKPMVDNKKWISLAMLKHIGVVFVCTLVASGFWWVGTVILTVLHYITDGVKITAKDKEISTPARLFIADQIAHIVTIIALWIYQYNLIEPIIAIVKYAVDNNQLFIILLGYLLITTPTAYFIDAKFASKQTHDEHNNGKWIGIFERIIILTLVLLNQYEAIGFLITGKSIIRFITSNETIHSEYVLLGTMMSYAIAILTGVLLNLVIVN